jgi:hypothetical protein
VFQSPSDPSLVGDGFGNTSYAANFRAFREMPRLTDCRDGHVEHDRVRRAVRPLRHRDHWNALQYRCTDEDGRPVPCTWPPQLVRRRRSPTRVRRRAAGDHRNRDAPSVRG